MIDCRDARCFRPSRDGVKRETGAIVASKRRSMPVLLPQRLAGKRSSSDATAKVRLHAETSREGDERGIDDAGLQARIPAWPQAKRNLFGDALHSTQACGCARFQEMVE